MPTGTPRLLLCTDEASGDRLAAAVLDRLAPRGVEVEARGIAGPVLRERGVDAVVAAQEVTGVGIVEALGALRRAPGALRRIAATLDAWRPDLVWTVDNPGLNLRIGRMGRVRGFPVVHLVSPQVWAWRPGRVTEVARAADLVLCLLPFEPAWYLGTRVRAEFVGHRAAWPLGAPPPDGGDAPVVVLAPGSRPSEVHALAPPFAAAAAHLRGRVPGVRFRVAVAPGLDAARLADLPGERREGLRAALEGAHAALIATGTATVKAAAAAVPFVAAYRVHPATWAFGRTVARVRHLALPNVLAGRALVPEHLQHLDPAAMAEDLHRLLDPSGRATARSLRALSAGLDGEHAVERIAARIEGRLQRGGSQQVTRP